MSTCNTIVLVGQTASGKTKTAITLARAIGGEVISADSRQVYSGLDIGTDKVAPADMQDVPHHVLDVADPVHERFTVSDFVKVAERARQDICARDQVPIVAGGTMLYIDAFFGNMSIPNVLPNEQLRAVLEQLPAEALYAELKQKDSARAASIDPHNKRRIIRALEIVESLGVVPQAQVVQRDPTVLWLGLYNDPETQKHKIQSRNREMLENGLLDEVRHLHEAGVPWERFAEFGFEYKYPAMHLQGLVTREECLQKMNQGTWRYARKQKSWWQDREEIRWFTPSEFDQLLAAVKAFLHPN